jgi:hypothetical protein
MKLELVLKTAKALSLGELEDHGERGLVRKTSLFERTVR